MRPTSSNLAWLVAVLFAVIAALGPATDGGPAQAATSPDEVLEDPALEARARSLAKELRCLVCQNQSIDDSDAGLARDLRQIVRERLLAGDTDAEIIDFVTARYGDFVLLRPPVKLSTLILWYGPPVIFVIAVIAIIFYLRRRRHDDDDREAPSPLSAEDQEKLDRLLNREQTSKT